MNASTGFLSSPSDFDISADSTEREEFVLHPLTFEMDMLDMAPEAEVELDGRLQSLTVSGNAGIDPSSDADTTPPGSPRHSYAKRSRGSDFDEDTLMKAGRVNSTPPKVPTAVIVVTPEGVRENTPFLVTPPTPPRMRSFSGNSSSPESPGVAARRVAAGKLPNKALVSLQQMRFECNGTAGMGLGVGPGSPGFDGMEGVSPCPTGPGFTFRLALGLTDQDKEREGRSPGEENMFDLTPTSTSSSLASPSQLRQPSPSSRRRLLPRSPGSPISNPFEGVKIPPTLRGSKILDKLNLSSPPALASPLSASPRDRPSYAATPPSPLIIRTSAFSYSNTGPLTPLTPSHMPGAPSLGSSAGFEWSCLPDSPTALSPMRSVFHDPSISPRQPFFLPTPGAELGGGRFGRSQSTLGGSPLVDRSPFFAGAF